MSGAAPLGSPGDVARSVLIIEDDDRIRRIVSIPLRREGLEVTEARSGEEGLAALAERPHDIVLLDLVLPGRSGFEVCREIRRVSTTRGRRADRRRAGVRRGPQPDAAVRLPGRRPRPGPARGQHQHLAATT